VSVAPTALRAEAPGLEAALARLRDEDALGELLERRGRAAELATEGGDVKLSWVDQVAWALDHPAVLAELETLAADLGGRFRHLAWFGMGGSVQTVHALGRLGLLAGAGPAVHPLDSTDPAALNRLLREIDGDVAATVALGVSMGMTSEEPISHLRWFTGLLEDAGAADPGAHVLVMTLPGSYLDEFARAGGSRRLDIQPDGESHTPGRMSAPSTRVFLLPAALAVGGRPGALRRVLERAQAAYRVRPGLDRAERDELAAADPFVRLAAWLSAQVEAGRDQVLLDLPERWRGLAAWIEQVVEESLGKGGRGLLAFPDQDLDAAAEWPDRFAVLRVDEGGGRGDLPDRPLAVLDLGDPGDPEERLAVTARVFAGWNLAVALLGWLQGITFAGQPAVEGYKRYARELRDARGPLPYPADHLAATADGRLALYTGASGLDLPAVDPAVALAAACVRLRADGRLGYLDVTLNAEPAGPVWERLGRLATGFASRTLARPVKVRSGPRDYHSTEQSETDGPPDLLSLRVMLRRHEPVARGAYDDRFLHAQALGTVLAMRDAGRPVLLAMLESAADAPLLDDLFAGAAAHIA
jgi:glucose-6-phosphate isomerase